MFNQLTRRTFLGAGIDATTRVAHRDASNTGELPWEAGTKGPALRGAIEVGNNPKRRTGLGGRIQLATVFSSTTVT